MAQCVYMHGSVHVLRLVGLNPWVPSNFENCYRKYFLSSITVTDSRNSAMNCTTGGKPQDLGSIPGRVSFGRNFLNGQICDLDMLDMTTGFSLSAFLFKNRFKMCFERTDAVLKLNISVLPPSV